MHPIICKIGYFTVHSYGLMLAIAVVVCMFLLRRDAFSYGIKSDFISDLVFWTVFGGILGARFFFILLNLDDFLQNPLEIIMIHHGGLAWQGSLLFGSLITVWFIRKSGQPVGKILDIAVPYAALGQAIGRVGCFLNGCCFGKEVAWGIYFPVHDARLHPTQLYSSAGLLIIFFVLKWFRKASFPCKDLNACDASGYKYGYKQGMVFVLYIVLASALRFVVQFFRADHCEIFMGLSIYQLVCIGFVVIAGIIFKKLGRR